MRVSKVVASMSADGVLTIVIPKRRLPLTSKVERQETREAIRV